MTTIKINKGWYWSAGDKFRWRYAGFDRAGVGLDARLLAQNDLIRVFVGNEDYLLDCKEAFQFVRKFDAYEVRGGVRLAVVSKSLFKTFHVEG